MYCSVDQSQTGLGIMHMCTNVHCVHCIVGTRRCWGVERIKNLKKYVATKMSLLHTKKMAEVCEGTQHNMFLKEM